MSTPLKSLDLCIVTDLLFLGLVKFFWPIAQLSRCSISCCSTCVVVLYRELCGRHQGSCRLCLLSHTNAGMCSAWPRRTQAEATAILQSLRRGIKTQDDFAKVAMTKSDCSSAKRGGDLSSFGRGKMQVRVQRSRTEGLRGQRDRRNCI